MEGRRAPAEAMFCWGGLYFNNPADSGGRSLRMNRLVADVNKLYDVSNT
jgi:hypothetical protein